MWSSLSLTRCPILSTAADAAVCQTLYASSDVGRAQKILIAAKYVGVDIHRPPFELGKDNKTPEFLKKSTSPPTRKHHPTPLLFPPFPPPPSLTSFPPPSLGCRNPVGKIPVLDTPSGPLFESNAIARYVARLRPDVGLYGDSFYQQAEVDQWIEFSANELEPARGVWVYTVSGALPSNNPKPLQEAKKDVEAALKVLDGHFLHHTYLVGNSVTLADITIFTALVIPYATLFSPALQQQFPNLLRWFHTIANQPHVKEVVPSVTFATEEAQPAGGKATKGGKPAGDAAAKGEKKEAPAKKEAVKEDKPKPAPKPAAGGDDDDEDKPRERPKNVLDDLPPTSMQLDPIKKLAFSQRPILSDFFEKLWPQFDAAGYTWFTIHYKYNDENTIYFKVPHQHTHTHIQHPHAPPPSLTPTLPVPPALTHSPSPLLVSCPRCADRQPGGRLHPALGRVAQVLDGRAERVRQRGRGDGAVEGQRRVAVPWPRHHQGDDRGEPGPGVLRVDQAGREHRRGQGSHQGAVHGRHTRRTAGARPSILQVRGEGQEKGGGRRWEHTR